MSGLVEAVYGDVQYLLLRMSSRTTDTTICSEDRGLGIGMCIQSILEYFVLQACGYHEKSKLTDSGSNTSGVLCAEYPEKSFDRFFQALDMISSYANSCLSSSGYKVQSEEPMSTAPESPFSPMPPPKSRCRVGTPSEPTTNNSVAITADDMRRHSIACSVIQAALIVVSDTFILFKKTNIICLNVINRLVEWVSSIITCWSREELELPATLCPMAARLCIILSNSTIVLKGNYCIWQQLFSKLVSDNLVSQTASPFHASAAVRRLMANVLTPFGGSDHKLRRAIALEACLLIILSKKEQSVMSTERGSSGDAVAKACFDIVCKTSTKLALDCLLYWLSILLPDWFQNHSLVWSQEYSNLIIPNELRDIDVMLVVQLMVDISNSKNVPGKYILEVRNVLMDVQNAIKVVLAEETLQSAVLPAFQSTSRALFESDRPVCSSVDVGADAVPCYENKLMKILQMITAPLSNHMMTP